MTTTNAPSPMTTETRPMPKTATTETRPASPAERIAQHEATIMGLNAEFDRYRALQPVAASSVLVGGQGFDPSKLRRKYELALLIDRSNIDLEEARADLARERAAALSDPDDLAAMEQAVAEAAVLVAAAEDEMRATRTAYSAAKSVLDFRRERVQAMAAAAAAAAAARVRWEAELAMDADRLDGVERAALMMGVTA